MEDGGWARGSHDCSDSIVGGDVAGVIVDATNAVVSSVDIDDVNFAGGFSGEDSSDDVIGNEAAATGHEDRREGLGCHLFGFWKVPMMIEMS